MDQTRQEQKPQNRPDRKTALAIDARVVLLWCAALAVCFFALKAAFDFYWRDRVDYARLDECKLVSYTAVQYLNTEEVMKKDFRYIDEKMLIDLGVAAGWGVLYGNFEEEEIQKTLRSEMWDIDVLAVRDEDGFRVPIGEMTEEDFSSRSQAMYKNSMESGEWVADSARGVSYEIDSENSGACWVSCTFESTGYEMLVKVSDEEFVAKLMTSIEIPVEDLVEEFSIPQSGGLICIAKDTGEVQAVKGSLHISKKEVLPQTPDEHGFMTIGGERCIAAESSNDQYRFIVAIPAGSSIWLRVFSSPLISISFTLLLLLGILYAWFLREDILLGRTVNKLIREKSPDSAVLFRRRVRLLFITIGVIVICMDLLLISLSIIDHTRMRISGLLEDSYQYFSTASDNEDIMTDAENKARIKIVSTINSMIGSQPALINEKALHDLSVALAGGIYVVNRDGTVAAGSGYWDYGAATYDLSGLTGDDSEWKRLREVLEGKADSQTADVYMNDEVMHTCGVQRHDSPGMILYMREKSRSSVTDSMFSSFPMAEGRILFAINLEKNEILSCSSSEYAGMSAEQFGMTEASLKPGFVGMLQLLKGKYFVVTQQYSGTLSCMGVSLRYIIKTYLMTVVLTVATGFLAAGLLLLLVLRIQMRICPIAEPEKKAHRHSKVTVKMNGNDPSEDEDKENGRFYDLEQDGLMEQVSADERWNPISLSFGDMYAEDKFKVVLHVLVLILLALVYWHPVIPSLAGGHMMVEFLLSREWQYGLNLYGISYALLMLVTILTLAALVRRFVLLIGGNFGSRGLTVARLIDSFINYVALIGAIAYGLTFLGVDTSTILASVGIVGLGLSLGAKDLVTDILAGVGIVFEGEFRNGDIVEIGGYRGTVIDIGVRTTKVLSKNNVKIFRNSEVSGVINMTQRYSFAEVDIQVGRSEPLEKVEEIFRKELPGIKKKIPEMGEDIRMLGIVRMTENCITLRITANCNEKDREKVERRLYREINLMMARENLKPLG